MRPLQAIGMGLLLTVLTARAGDPGVDLFPDPAGWSLVCLGAYRLPERVAPRRWLFLSALVACLVAVPLWLPVTAGALLDADEALLWTLDLPRLVFLLLLAAAMSRAAGAGGDTGARAWWRLVLGATVVTVVLPAVVYGAGAASLADVAGGVAVATVLTCLVLCFSHSSRPWASDAAPATTGRSDPTQR